MNAAPMGFYSLDVWRPVGLSDGLQFWPRQGALSEMVIIVQAHFLAIERVLF